MFFLFETVLIAEDNNHHPIGFVSLLDFQPKISGLYVHPGFMNQGVGRKLLKQLELMAIERRIKTLVVMSSLESIDFYKKNGYQFKRETGIHSLESVWIPCELLEKELIPSTPTERLVTKTIATVLSFFWG